MTFGKIAQSFSIFASSQDSGLHFMLYFPFLLFLISYNNKIGSCLRLMRPEEKESIRKQIFARQAHFSGVSLDSSWFIFYLGMISVSAFKIKPNI